tara:strand:+ start:901 stop:2628 length:1728 start_codon:yes stop_codon:yes gene_type:complete
MAASSNLPYVQRFIYQQAYKNISVGIAPWWPAQRGSMMTLSRTGTDREGGKGFKLTPEDKNTDPNYSTWVRNYGRPEPAGTGMGWESIQTYPMSILSDASKESVRLAKILNNMFDFEHGKPVRNKFGTSIENEIKNLDIIEQMPEDIKKHFMDGPLLSDLGNLGQSQTMDHLRTSAEGTAVINALAEAVGPQTKVGQAMIKTAYGVDTTDSVASKWLTGEYAKKTQISETGLKTIEAEMRLKIEALNDQFLEVGASTHDLERSIYDLFAGTAYSGKTTTIGGYTPMAGFGKHVNAIFLGIARQHARENKHLKHDSLAFVEPIGRTGYAAFVVLAPKWTKDGVLQVKALIDFKSFGGNGYAATSSHLMMNALSLYSQNNNLRDHYYTILNNVDLANIAVSTSDRIKTIGNYLDIGLGQVVDMGALPLVATRMYMTSGQIADSIHMQIEQWAKSPDNRKRFEKWYKRARFEANKLYHLWRDKHVLKFGGTGGGVNPTVWRADQGSEMDIHTYEAAPTETRGQQYEVTKSDYGIWNQSGEGQNVGALEGPEAKGIHISPFLISRNKFISKFGVKPSKK